MNVDIVKETCLTCHVTFWITLDHQKQLYKSKAWFYCPNKHAQQYDGDTCEQKLAKEVEKRQRAEQMHRNAVGRECANERRVSAYKGVVTKMKNKQEQDNETLQRQTQRQ